MKKASLIVAAVLLAVLVAGCDNFAAPKNVASVVSYDDEGRELVEVSVGLDEESARSLFPSVAKDYATYYEVVFQNGAGTNQTTDYRRISWKGISSAKIKLWSLDYDNTTAAGHGTAVLFAGTQSDRTLLGVGKIEKAYKKDGSDTGTVVSATTTRITFKVVALDAKITATTGSTSAFKITGGTPVGATPTPAPTTPSGQLPTVQVMGMPIPIFVVNKDDPAITATFTLKLYDVGGSAAATWTDYNSLVKVRDEGSVRHSAASIGGFKSVTLEDAIFDVTTLILATTPANGNLPDVLVLKLKTVADKDGMCELMFEVPVCPLAPIAFTGSPEPWVIRGGINSNDYDDGSADPAQGGLNSLILLGVGEYEASLDDSITIEVK
jgi:hypothetical protein